VETLLVAHLVKIKLKAESALELDGKIAKNKKRAIIVARVLQSV
jgi:hypothetical protein